MSIKQINANSDQQKPNESEAQKNAYTSKT